LFEFVYTEAVRASLRVARPILTDSERVSPTKRRRLHAEAEISAQLSLVPSSRASPRLERLLGLDNGIGAVIIFIRDRLGLMISVADEEAQQAF